MSPSSTFRQRRSLVQSVLETQWNDRMSKDLSAQKRSDTSIEIELVKGKSGFGFNIAGGVDNQYVPDDDGIFVTKIAEGGAAKKNGKLKIGDRIISAKNSVETRMFKNIAHEDAVSFLRETKGKIVLVVEHRVLQRNGTIMRTSRKKAFYVRTAFDYDPSKDSDLPGRGLAFHRGDILHIRNAGDDEWWQARIEGKDGEKSKLGIVPSARRWERKQYLRNRSVKFGHGSVPVDLNTTLDSIKKLTFSRKFPFMKSVENLEQSCEELSEVPDVENVITKIPTYTVVEQMTINYVRPVIILGQLHSRITDDLIADDSGKYVSCVPHTTRDQKPEEIDGRDYYFISKEEMEAAIANQDFIEAGQYHENLYGTSIAAVRDVAESGKYCVVGVSGKAIKRLHSANLYPIVPLIKPKSVESIMEMNKRLTEEEARRTFETVKKMECEFADYITEIVEGDTAEEIYEKVKEVIEKHSTPTIWVPRKNQNLHPRTGSLNQLG